jgi:hypothetical protein
MTQLSSDAWVCVANTEWKCDASQPHFYYRCGYSTPSQSEPTDTNTPLYQLSDARLLTIAADLTDARHMEARNTFDARTDHREHR